MTKTFDQLVLSLNEKVKNQKEGSFDSKKLLAAFSKMVPHGGHEPKTPVHHEKGDALSYSDQAYVKWFGAFDKIQRISGINITLPRYMGRFTRGPPVGTYPKFKERIRHIRWKAEHGWDPYEKKEEEEEE